MKPEGTATPPPLSRWDHAHHPVAGWILIGWTAPSLMSCIGGIVRDPSSWTAPATMLLLSLLSAAVGAMILCRPGTRPRRVFSVIAGALVTAVGALVAVWIGWLLLALVGVL